MPLTSLDVANDTAPDNFLNYQAPIFFPENYNTVSANTTNPPVGEKSPFLDLVPGSDPDKKVYANTPTYYMPRQVSNRYDQFLLGQDNENINHELQTGWERTKNAVDNTVEKFGAYLTQTAGFIGGALAGATGGSINLVNEAFGGEGKVVNNGHAISLMTDNFLANLGEAWKENVQERAPIYKGSAYTNGDIWQKLGTSDWWLDDAVDRLALTASMLVPGVAEAKGFGLFGAALDEAGTLTATGLGAKGLQALADNPGLYSKLGKMLGSDIYKVAAEGIVDTDAALALRFKGLVGAAQKTELYTWNVIGQSALNGREAQVGIRKALNEQREAGLNNLTDEQIENKAAEGAAKGFAYTLPLSLAASLIELPQIFSTAKTAEKMFSKFFTKDGIEMVEGALEQTVRPSIGKLIGKTLLTGLEHGQNESAQVAIGRYLEETIAGKTEGQKVKMAEKNGLAGIWYNFLDNVNDPNGQNNIALGTIQGMLMTVGGYAMKSIGGEKSSKLFGEYAKTDARNRQFINDVIKAKAARRFWTTPEDFYEKDGDGKVVMTESFNNTSIPKINQDRLTEAGLSIIDTHLDHEQRMQAIANKDYDALEKLNYKSLTAVAQNFFDDPQGMEYLTNLLKFEAKNQKENIDRINDSKNGQEITPSIQLSESIDYVTKLKKAYDAIDQRHAGFTELEIDTKDKTEVEAKKNYIRDMQQAQLVNSAEQIYIQNKLAKNTAELLTLETDGTSVSEERIQYLKEQNATLETEQQEKRDAYKNLVDKEIFKKNFETYKSRNEKAQEIVEDTKTIVAERDAEIAKNSTIDENGNVVPNTQVISITTKNGIKDFEVGKEYFIGRNVDLSKTGKKVYSPEIIKIISENGDGTYTVEDQNGVTKIMTKEQFTFADPVDYRKALLDKKFKWFINNWNSAFKHFNIKVNGKPAEGRLSWSSKNGRLVFNYLDAQGKLKQKEITRKDFVFDNKKYKHPMVMKIGELTAADKQIMQELKDSVDERDETAIQDHFKVLAELYDELVDKKNKTDELINKKNVEVESLKKEFTALEEKIKDAKGDKRSKINFRFKSETRKALSAAMRLSKAQEQIQQEIENLNTDREEIESNINYVSDLMETVEELPNDNIDLLVELDEQKKNLNETYTQVGKEINALSKVLKAVENALQYAIDLVHDLIKSFESKYPKTPNVLGQEWVDFLKENPNFLKLKPDYKADLAKTEDLVAQIEDLDIVPNERHVSELNESIAELQNQLKNIDQELKNRDLVMQRFEKVVEAYEQQLVEEQKMQVNKALKDKFLGTNSKVVQNFFSNKNYEPVSKKPWKSVVGGTIAVQGEEGEVVRDHHIRAQRFGNRFISLKNKDSINGVVVVNNTQIDLIPGLTEHLVGETGLNPNDVIALVMVQKNANGTIKLVDEFGKGIEGKKENESLTDYNQRLIDSAIYQVFPSDKLEQTYIKEGKKVKESMFRDSIPPTVKADLTKKYQDWRTEQLKQTTLSAPQNIEASFGIPEYVTELDDTNEEQRDFGAKTPVTQTKLISNKNLRTEPCVIVATSNNSIKNGSVTFDTPEGRVFLKVGDEGLVKLQNRQFTKQEANTLFDVIKQFAINSLNEGDIASSKKLRNWLNSVVYWGIPKTQEGAPKKSGYNSIFFKDVDGQARLFISGLGESFDFTPMGLENRKNDIISLLQQMYNNTDATLVREENYNNEYNEIIGIDKEGNPITRLWKNYQTYLLSDKLPDVNGIVTDKSEARDINEIPLTTQIKPITKEGDTNRKGIYFTLKNTVDIYGEQTAPPITPGQAKTNNVSAPVTATAPIATQQTQQAPVQQEVSVSKPSGYNFNGKVENEVLLGLNGQYGKVNASFDGKRFLEIWNKDPFDPNTDPKKTAEIVTKLIAEKILNFGEGINETAINNIQNLLGLDSQKEAIDVIKTIVFKDKFYPVAIEKSIIKADPMETAEPVVETNISETPTPEEIEEAAFNDEDILDEMQKNALDNPAPDDALYRLQVVRESTNFKPENWDKVEKDFAKMLPNTPLYRVKNLIEATNGRQAWGMLHDAAIYVYENAEVGTAYHEVFEAVWKMFAGPIEKQAIIKEFKNREGSYFDEFQQKEIKYSEATDQEIKEQLAEEFREAVLNDKLGKPLESKSLIGKLFSQLIAAIKSLFVGPNAQKNTQELFNKIGDGYYAKYNPYESNLSYANVGVIDIENASGDETSEFSIAKIPAAQQHDIIQHMTFATLRDMIRTNKSLFEISALPKRQLYDSLKNEIKQRISFKRQQLVTALKNNEISKEQIPSVERDINNLVNLYKNVIKDWSKLEEKHQEQLKTFSIEFDENDELILNDENKSGKADWQNARMIDGFRKSSSAVKILLASLPETELVDGKVRPKYSSIGGFTLMDSAKVYINLKEKLHSSIDTDDMFNKLRDMALENPNYETLYYRMTKKIPKEGEPTSLLNLGANDINLISAFFSSMKGQNADVITVFILPNGETVISDSTLTNSAKQSQRELESNIKEIITSDKSPYFTYNKTNGKYKTISSIDTVPLLSNNLGTYVTFLKNIGIDFKESELDSKLSNSQLTTFRKAVEGIKKSLIWLSKSPKNAEDTTAIEGLVNINAKSLSVSGQLFQLGVIKSILENPEYESTYFNLNGDRTQTHVGVNVLSRIYDTLSRLSNINQLDGTDSTTAIKSYYSYLLTDTFVKDSSVMLGKMFDIEGDGEGDRIKFTEHLMHPVFIDGTVNEQTGKRKDSAKLTQRQRYVQELNLNLDGIYINLVSGKSNETGIKMHDATSPFVTKDGVENKTYHRIFEKYFVAELNLAREDRPIVETKGRKKSDLRFFKDILGEEIHKDITSKVNKNLTSEEVYKKYEGVINSALENFINKDVKDRIQALKEYKILTGGELGFDVNEIEFSEKENISQETLNENLKALSVNYMIANIEMHKLIYSDPYQYKDELKRIGNFGSPKQAILYGSAQFNTSLNNVYNEGYELNDIGHTDFIRDNFRAGTLSDVWANDESLDKYDDPYEETDGGGYISIKAARVLRLHESTWTKDNERQYRYDIAFEKQVKSQNLSIEEVQAQGLNLSMDEVDLLDAGNPGVKSTYTPIKPIAAGSKNNGRNYNDMVLHKFALVPFSFRILHEINSESNAIKLYNKMQKEDVDYVVYASGSKVGTEKTLDLYDEDGNFNEAPFETEFEKQNPDVPQGVNKIPFSIFGIQSEVPSKDTIDVTQGSQITKLATLDLLEAGVPADFLKEINDINKRFEEWNKLTPEQKEENKLYKEILNNQSILEAKNKNGYNGLLRKLGIKKTKEGFVLSDPDRLSNTLREQLSFQEINENIIATLKGFKKGEVVLEATPAYRQIKNVLYSIADKNITSQKITGGMKVQIPGTLLESVKAKAKVITDTNGKEKFVYVSKELKFYTNKDGERVCEIMLPRWFNSSLSDAELIKFLNTTDEGKKILQGISFRTPTQKQNSIDVFRIAKFLPKEFGDSVVVPSQLVKKSGSDFDIDKLSIYLKNIIKQGSKLKALEFLTDKNSKVEQRYYDWVVESSDKDVTKYINFLSNNKIKEIKTAFKTELKALNDKYKLDVTSKKDELYKGYENALNNISKDKLSDQDEYLQSLFSVGQKVFFELSDKVKEDYFDLRSKMYREGINGPKEIENYLALTINKLQTLKNSTDIETCNNLVSIYTEELKVLGENETFLKEFKEGALNMFRNSKKIEIDKINDVTSKLSEEIKDKRNEEIISHNMEVAKELAEVNELPTLEEFKKFNIYDQNTKKALENAYIESLENLISHPENFNRLTKPNSAEDMKNLAKKINKQIGKVETDYSNVGNMLKITFMNPLRQDFVGGSYAIGIAAVGQTGLSQRQRGVITIDTNRLDDKIIDPIDAKWLGDGKIKFKNYNKIKVNGQERASLSGVKSAGTNVDISDINSQIMDGYVDIEKDPWIMDLGAKPNVAPTYLLLLGLGVPVESIAYFIKQPIIQDYLTEIENNGYSWLFIEDYIDDIKEKYEPAKSYKDTGAKVVEIPSETDLFKMLAFSNPDNTAKMSDLQKAQQQFMLDEFTKYAMMANHMFTVTQATNYDTATLNDSMSIFQKQLQLEKARKTIISSADDLLASSFVGPMKDLLFNVRDAFSTVEISDRTKNSSGGASTRAVTEAVATPYALKLPGRDFTKVSQKIKNSLFDWAMQTDRNQNLYLQKILLGTSTEESAAKQIMNYVEKIKANKNHPLNKNLVINSFKMEAGSDRARFKLNNKVEKIGKPDNLYLTGRDNKVYMQNQIINSFEEIKQDLVKTNMDLYGKLIRVAILQSGLTTSPISFTQLLPYEDFVTIYNESLSKLENMPNLAEFKNINIFERTNWSDTDVTPYKKATLRIDKNGKLYNVNENFINQGLVNAMNKNLIPKVINVSKFSAEGRSDFMVYSWESKINKAEKIRARKAGDTSYINKALMQKVYKSDGTPLIQTAEYNGKVYENYIYKAINAWGDSYRAQEYYNLQPVEDEQGNIVGYSAPASKFDNGFIKVEKVTDYRGNIIRNGEVEDSVIEELFNNGTSAATEGSLMLKDGMIYSFDEIGADMLEQMGYSVKDINRILKDIC